MMIKSLNSLKYYLECDRIALERKGNIVPFYDIIWRFQRLLRFTEYLNNISQSQNYFIRVIGKYFKLKLKLFGEKYGFSIPLNVFGPGLAIIHIGPVIVNKHAKIGNNCRIHVGVNIGASGGIKDAAPIIGDNVYIGPGAKIFGKIQIADNIVIGANAVVNRDVKTKGITIAGVPSRKISDQDSSKVLIKATEIVSNYKKNDQI